MLVLVGGVVDVDAMVVDVVGADVVVVVAAAATVMTMVVVALPPRLSETLIVTVNVPDEVIHRRPTENVRRSERIKICMYCKRFLRCFGEADRIFGEADRMRIEPPVVGISRTWRSCRHRPPERLRS